MNETNNDIIRNNLSNLITNVKIVGLNVCGLRSKLENGHFEVFAKDYDILCLSETYCDNIDLSNTTLNGYSCFVKEKIVPSHRYGGIHGLCMLVKNEFKDHATLLKETQSPYVLWVKFNKETFGIACIIGSVYLPGENSRHRDNERLDTITNDIFILRNSYNLPICLIGDMNSRTGNLDDTFVIEHSIINNCEIDDMADELFDLNTNEVNSNMSEKRSNKDIVVNDYGIQLIEFCKANNMKIINGRTGADKGIGDYTFNSPTGKSSIDYCITSHNFLSHILNFEVDILDKTLSDFHSPIILTVKTNHNTTNDNEFETDPSPECDIEYEHIYSKWNNEKKNDFQTKFNLTQIESISQTLNSFEFDNPNQRDIDDIVKTISEICIMSGLETGLSKKLHVNNNSQVSCKDNKPWFDTECQKKRKHYIRIRNRLKKSKSFLDIAIFKNESKIYKKNYE